LEGELVQSLASKMVIVIEAHQLLESFRTIMSARPEDVFDVLLHQAVVLLQADRADFTTKRMDSPDRELHYEKIFGDNGNVQPGQRVNLGFIQDTWTDRLGISEDHNVWRRRPNARWTGNVARYRELSGNYHESDYRTKSDIAVRFETTASEYFGA